MKTEILADLQIWISVPLNLISVENENKYEIDCSCWLKNLFQMVGPRRIIVRLVILQKKLQ